MSKHTNKVHGKLNVIIVAVVLIIGVLGYLLVQSDSIDFNPADLSGSGNQAIKGAKKAEKYDNRSEVVVDLDGEEVQEFLNNQDFQKMSKGGTIYRFWGAKALHKSKHRYDLIYFI